MRHAIAASIALAGLFVSPPTRASFLAEAAAAYRAVIATENTGGRLDRAPAELAHLRDVMASLRCALAPADRNFGWELHTTEDPAVAAFSLPNGGLMIGRPYLHRMALRDGEIAMMLAHEMAHVTARHRRARTEDDMGSDPTAELGAIALATAQEDEADRIGFALATKAGWRPATLLSFFDKLAATEPAGTFSRTHRTPLERRSALLAQAEAGSREKAPGSACAPPGESPLQGRER